MEKQRNRSTSFISRRLLILPLLFIISASNLFSQTLTAAKIKELRIIPAENQQLFTDIPVTFEVIVPYIKASQLSFQVPEEIDNVSFKSLQKQNIYEENSTKISIVLIFTKKGEYNLKTLPVTIKGISRSIQFSPVTIKLNPKNQKPVLVLQFENGNTVSTEFAQASSVIFDSPAGKKINFRVSLQYGVNLVQFNYDIPKDSIFIKLREYDINEVKYREKEYSEDLIPIADFEWTPLAEGNIALPVFYATITGYNGYRNDVIFSDYYINAVNQLTASGFVKKDFYDSIFEKVNIDENQSKSHVITKEECEQLAALRTKEKYSIRSSVRRERIEFEKSLLLPYDQKEFCVLILYAFIALCGFFVFVLIVCIKKHRTLPGILAGTLIICSFVLIIYSTVLSNRKAGICTGCMITSIPEENAAVCTELSSGCRVRILEEAGEWIFVEFGKINGWCKKENILWI